MKTEIYYSLEADDREFVKQLGECLNTIQFVFTHNPELALTRRELTPSGKRRKLKEGHHNPHGVIFNGNPFTAAQLQAWSDWVNKVIAAGKKAVPLQHPAYRQGHEMSLARFRETADAFIASAQQASAPNGN